jgi:hypothetical protein
MAVIRFGPTRLTSGEFLVLLFHVERSLPYGKEADCASLNQMTHGIRRRDGRRIRDGCGLAPSTSKAANRSLEEKGILERVKRNSVGRGHEPTQYRVRWDALSELFARELVCTGGTLGQASAKPMAGVQPTPLADSRPHRDQSSQNSDQQSPEASRSYEMANTIRRPQPLSESLSQQTATGGVPQHPTGAKAGERTESLRQLSPQAIIDRLHRDREGRPLSKADWWALRDRLEVRGVSLADFTELVLQNQGDWRSFGAGLRFLEKNFFAKTSPVHIDENSPQPPPARCGKCGEPIGKGVRIEEGHLVPCDCASPEWAAKLDEINARELLQSRKSVGREPKKNGIDETRSEAG